MEHVGNILLHVSLILAAWATVMSIVGSITKRPALVDSARNAFWALCGLVAISSAMLIGCLLTGKYYMKYVYQYSNSTMPVFYKFAAFWGGQEGSLLFWLLILCIYSGLALWSLQRRKSEFLPIVIATLSIISGFFLVLLVFEANPFDAMPFAVADGKGLNPLLQNYYMIIHPPSLYLGYVGMSVPFAFAMAALVTGRLDNQWLREIRKWTLTAWFFLSLGNLLGASWAYEVLGWGGYWGWDPVENAAFMPWLVVTAFLHSVIIQEKRNMLRTWNMILIVLSFLLTLTGTFLTRSGIVSSVHSFAQSDIGKYFLGFLILWTTISTGLIIYRLPILRSKNTLDAMISRESAFLFNNVIFLGATFAVLWGTLFPVLSEWVRGSKITVGPPFFNGVMVPIGLLLLVLTGIGPMVAWRKTTPEQLRRNFLWPVGTAIAISIVVMAFVSRKPYVVASFSFSAFVLATVALEYFRGIRVRQRTLREDPATATLRLVASNRRRYGGYIVHVGIVSLFVGFTGEAFKTEADLQLKKGETATLGRYTLHYQRLTMKQDDHQETVFANMDVTVDGKPLKTLYPARVFYKSTLEGEPPQPNTLVSIHRTLREDLYLALLSFDSNNQTAFIKAVVNPLVQFVWLGGLFLMFGTVIVMWPAAAVSATAHAVKAAAIGALLLMPMMLSATSTYAASPKEEEIAKKIKCQCGCNFPDLHSCSCGEWAVPAKAEIAARLSRGEDEETILKYFLGRHGETVLTTPIQKGFNRTVWYIPVIGVAFGALAGAAVLRRWRRGAVAAAEPVAGAGEPPAIDDKYLKQIDRELYGK